SYDTHIIIKAGTWRNIFGGNRNMTFTGDTIVELSNMTFGGNLSAKNEGGTFSGTAKLVFDLRGGKTVTGGTFKMPPTKFITDTGYIGVQEENTYKQIRLAADTVVVDGTGQTEGAYTTLEAGIAVLPETGGTAIVVGDTVVGTSSSVAQLASKDGKVTITGENGAKLIIALGVRLGSETEIDNIELVNTSTSEGFISANGNKLTIGENVKTSIDGTARWLTIRGASDQGDATNYDTHLVLKAGTYRYIYGGGKGNFASGKATVQVSNVTAMRISAECENSTFSGTAELILDLRGHTTVTATEFVQVPTFLTDDGYTAVLDGETYKQILAATGPVYVDGTGETEGSYPTVEEAMSVLPSAGGEVIVCGDTTVGSAGAAVRFPTKNGEIVITGLNGAVLTIAGEVIPSGELVLGDIGLKSDTGVFTVINGTELEIDDTVTVDGTLTVRVGQNGTAVIDNDGVSVVPASGFDLVVDGNTYTVKIKKIGYISNSTGNDNNNGLSADKPKMYQGKVDGKGLVSMLYGGGTAIACGDFGVGSEQTWDYGGRVVVTGAYEGTDYKNIDNRTGFFSISDSVKLTIVSDLTFDDILLSAGKNSVFYVASGATLTITDSVVWLTDTLTIIVEEGAAAIIQSGKCAAISGKGTITVEHCEHSEFEYGVDFEPATCMQNGVRYNRCKNCGLYIGEIDEDAPVDLDAHKLSWTFEDESATAICEYCCGYSVTQVYRNVTEIYLSSKGTLEGTYTVADPINDFGLAMAIAAAQDGDVTIYVLDNAVIPNSEVHDTYNVFVEPEHANTITVKGIGGSGVLRFNNDKESEVMIYALSGPTTFECIEFSPWSSTGRLCIVARHNKLVLGENISSDLYEKGSNGLEIIGGCYETFLSSVGGCEKLDTDVTLLSGNYTYIYAGAYNNSTCCVDSYTYNGSSRSGGDVHLTLGDVTARREIRAGNYGDSSVYANMNDVHINIVGTVVAVRYFVFTPSSSSYKAQNVYLNIHSGEVHVGQELGNMNQWDYVWGGAADGESITQRIANKLYVYADPEGIGAMSVYSTVLAELKVDSRNNGKWVAFIMDENYCAVNGGAHTPAGEAIEHVDATCNAEGYDIYTCLACGAKYAKKIEKPSHIYGSPVTIDATCVSPELERVVCVVCGDTVYSTSGSTFADHTDPEKTGICQVCNTDLTLICNHSFGEPISFNSGCGTGTKRICNLCGKEEVKVIGDGHNYGAYSITVAPTATTAGVKTRTCKICGKVDTAVVYAQNAIDATAFAVDANGNLANFSIENTKLSKSEKVVLNELLQKNTYGSEVKVSYETEGDVVKNIVYMIPVPKEYADYENIRVIVRDDNGEMHDVYFEIEKGYIVFVF
ncbi:MAG: hypothetical protein IJA60_05025, partial [Clostridia bacterium]|nr:hypothetical protein [Clostridia bacterium]